MDRYQERSASGNEGHFHVLYLGKWGPTEQKISRNAQETNFAFGFYDEIAEEIYQKIDYQHAFALKYPTQFIKKALAVKQIVVLEELSEYFWGKTVPAGPQDPLRLLAAHGPKGEPLMFLGAVFLSFDMLHTKRSTTDKLLEACIGRFAKKIQQTLFPGRAEEEAPIADSTPGLSEDAIVRLFKCPNCSDICLTINTNQLADIFLLAKVAQQAAGITPQNPFSSSWCFASMRNDMGTLLENIEPLCKKNREHITIDFRLSFTDKGMEREFLKCAPASPSAETRLTPPVERVGGVLGTGSYSVHLPFDEYMLLHCALWGTFSSVEEAKKSGACPEEVLKKGTLLHLLLQCIVEQEKKLIISNQRLRFCYQQALAAYLMDDPSEDTGETAPEPPREAPSPTVAIERDLNDLQRNLSIYRHRLRNYEYSFSECLAMVRDLLYTYNDILYAESIHSYIFVCQVLALLAGMRRGLDEIVNRLKESEDIPQSMSLAKKYTARLIDQVKQAVVSISEYNRSLMVFSRHTANSPNYEMQSKVNIEKYLIGYAMFLQEICDLYRLEKARDAFPLYPYVYIDVQKATVEMSTLFWRFHDEDDPVPALLPVACPNYRRFANAYWLLPTLTHEISHQFRYFDRPERNEFVAEQGLQKVAFMLVEDLLLELADRPAQDDFLLRKLVESVTSVLTDSLKKGRYAEVLARTRMNELEQNVIYPFILEFFWAAVQGENHGRTLLQPNAAKLYDRLLVKAGFSVCSVTALQTKWQSAPPRASDAWFEQWDESRSMLIWFILNEFTQKNVADSISLEKLKSACSQWESILQICHRDAGDEDTEQDLTRLDTLLETMSSVLNAPSGSEREQKFNDAIYDVSAFRDAIVCLQHYAVRRILQDHPWLHTKWNGRDRLEKLANGQALDVSESLASFWTIWFKLTDPEQSSQADGDKTNAALLEQLYNKGMELLDSTYNMIVELPDVFSEQERRDYAKRMFCEVFFELQECLSLWEGLLRLLGRQIRVTLHSGTSGEIVEKLIEKIRCTGNELEGSPLMATQENHERLNKLQDGELLKKAMSALSGKRAVSVWCQPWVNYTQIYAEICSDLGMCAAFQFNATGYLVLIASQYIQTNDSTDVSRVHFDFRDQRFCRVVDVLLSLEEKGSDKLVHHTVLYEELRQALLTTAGKVCGLLEDAEQEGAFISDSSELTQELNERACRLAAAAQNIQKETRRDLPYLYSSAAQLEEGLNQVGEKLRDYLIKQVESYENTMEHDSLCAETEKQKVNKLRSINDQTNKCLEYARILQHIANVMGNSRMSLPEDSMEGDNEFFHFRKLYKEIERSHWIQSLHQDPFVGEIREHYNNWCKEFMDSYDLKKQNAFIYRYYDKAHIRYRGLTHWERASAAGDGSSGVPKSWFSLFDKGAGIEGKETPEGREKCLERGR